jgi:SAM-dependent methyltransferase
MAVSHEFSEYLAGIGYWNSFVMRATHSLSNDIRTFFANRYLRGEGIEIGAQCNPLIVSSGKARLSYVDRLGPEEICALHGLPEGSMVMPHMLAEADDLAHIEDGSLDFVVSNHLLEHMDDPIAAIVEWLRVLKDKGILLMSVPDYRANEYDFMRKPAGVGHLISAYRNRSASQRLAHKIEHWQEYIETVDGSAPGSERFLHLLETYRAHDYRIHFHVYDRECLEGLIQFIHGTLRWQFNMRDCFWLSSCYENIFVLEKSTRTTARLCHCTRRRPLRNLLLLLFLRLRATF